MESSQEGRLGLNQYDYFSWKGKTFSEIYSVLQKNSNNASTHPTSFFKPLPLKHYRLTVHNSDTKRNHVQKSASIKALLETPGGTTVQSASSEICNDPNQNTLHFVLPNNSSQKPCNACDDTAINASQSVSLSQADNARRRVRSAGMNRPKYNPIQNNRAENYRSSSQYLKGRNRTFVQNQFTNLRIENASNSAENVYASNTIQYCNNGGTATNYVPVYYKPNNTKFAIQGAVDSSSRLARLKYDTITDVGGSMRSAFGPETANALAYGVPPNGYTIKDKIGYPNKCTPNVKSACYRIFKGEYSYLTSSANFFVIDTDNLTFLKNSTTQLPEEGDTVEGGGTSYILKNKEPPQTLGYLYQSEQSSIGTHAFFDNNRFYIFEGGNGNPSDYTGQLLHGAGNLLNSNHILHPTDSMGFYVKNEDPTNTNHNKWGPGPSPFQRIYAFAENNIILIFEANAFTTSVDSNGNTIKEPVYKDYRGYIFHGSGINFSDGYILKSWAHVPLHKNWFGYEGTMTYYNVEKQDGTPFDRETVRDTELTEIRLDRTTNTGPILVADIKLTRPRYDSSNTIIGSVTEYRLNPTFYNGVTWGETNTDPAPEVLVYTKTKYSITNIPSQIYSATFEGVYTTFTMTGENLQPLQGQIVKVNSPIIYP